MEDEEAAEVQEELVKWRRTKRRRRRKKTNYQLTLFYIENMFQFSFSTVVTSCSCVLYNNKQTNS